MTSKSRPSPGDWLACALLGVLVGTVLLGIGGRIAMRGIAVLSGAMPGFSLGGSGTVVFLGALSGLGGAMVFMLPKVLLPRQPVLRGALFWGFLVLVSLRGLRPLDLQRVLLFMPLIAAYGVALQGLWCRLQRGRRPPLVTSDVARLG